MDTYKPLCAACAKIYKKARYSVQYLPPYLWRRKNAVVCFGCGQRKYHDMNLDVSMPGKTIFAKPERMRDRRLGQNIRDIRLKNDLTLKEFGRAFGEYQPSPGIISGWERGLTMPDPQMLKRICEIGETDLDSLLHSADRGNPCRSV